MHSEADLIWNNQPEEAMKVDAIVIFKRHLDSVYGQEGFRANTGKWDQPSMPA